MDENMERETPEEGTEAEVVAQENGADDAAEAAGEKEQEAAEPAKKQSREDNARFQAARKAGESAGYKRAQEEIRATLRKLGMTDPDGGAEIDTMEALSGYAERARSARLKKRAEETGRTEEDVAEEEDAREIVRQKKREEAERKKKDAERESQKEWVARDAAEFMAAHPEVDLTKLDENAKFRKFCGSRYGREPLSALYDDWCEMVGDAAAAKAVDKSRAKEERTTGAGGGGVSDGLTAAQQKALDEWNREYPSMKMTAKEFLKR